MQNRAGGNRRVKFFIQTVESSCHEHSQPQGSRILDLQPDLGSSNVGIQDGAEVIDAALENHVRVGAQMNVGVLTQANEGQVILINVAHYPDARQIRDGEQIG